MKTLLALVMLCSVPVNAEQPEGWGNGGSKEIVVDVDNELGGGFGF